MQRIPQPLEHEAVHRRLGKWSDPTVPHAGWECIDVEDLGAPQSTCEMCETRGIRYVHSMHHSHYPQVLRVGCVCAGHMENDQHGAVLRDQFMKSRSAKRKRWPTRRWRVSRKGNEFIVADEFRVTVYPGRFGWRVTVAASEGEFVHHSHRICLTSDDAKLAGFDLVTRLLARGAA
jgi:hypothetical protein